MPEHQLESDPLLEANNYIDSLDDPDITIDQRDATKEYLKLLAEAIRTRSFVIGELVANTGTGNLWRGSIDPYRSVEGSPVNIILPKEGAYDEDHLDLLRRRMGEGPLIVNAYIGKIDETGTRNEKVVIFVMHVPFRSNPPRQDRYDKAIQHQRYPIFPNSIYGLDIIRSKGSDEFRAFPRRDFEPFDKRFPDGYLAWIEIYSGPAVMIR